MHQRLLHQHDQHRHTTILHHLTVARTEPAEPLEREANEPIDHAEGRAFAEHDQRTHDLLFDHLLTVRVRDREVAERTRAVLHDLVHVPSVEHDAEQRAHGPCLDQRRAEPLVVREARHGAHRGQHRRGLGRLSEHDEHRARALVDHDGARLVVEGEHGEGLGAGHLGLLGAQRREDFDHQQRARLGRRHLALGVAQQVADGLAARDLRLLALGAHEAEEALEGRLPLRDHPPPLLVA
mmetsp:Transcript_69835/g.195254  ORF Transcript_69835/g.195254 Transcript_69835/m.195254 type:complete len:238 (-) Transcript_69835:3034-3747(-)